MTYGPARDGRQMEEPDFWIGAWADLWMNHMVAAEQVVKRAVAIGWSQSSDLIYIDLYTGNMYDWDDDWYTYPNLWWLMMNRMSLSSSFVALRRWLSLRNPPAGRDVPRALLRQGGGGQWERSPCQQAGQGWSWGWKDQKSPEDGMGL